MKKNWGYLNSEDNAELQALAVSYVQKLKSIKTKETRKKHTAEFMKAYLQIGEDPTDTVIRNNVWVFLCRVNKNKLTLEELDDIWETEVKQSQKLQCVVS